MASARAYPVNWNCAARDHAEQVWHLIRVLGMASNKVTLLSCHRSLSDSRERYPAALFQQAAEQMEITPVIVPTLPENSEQALGRCRGHCWRTTPLPTTNPLYIRPSPIWSLDKRPRRAREWDGLTTYDGWLGTPTPELAITAQHRIFSPSRLEMLARCPYRYFLNHALEIQPIEKAETDPTRWLDPLSYGALLHSLFHKFMQTLKARGRTPGSRTP